jgi:Signal transduction histidine kinase
MFSGRKLQDLLWTSSFRQALTIAGVFLLVTLASIAIGRQLMENLLLSHVTEMILKDVDGQNLSTRLEESEQVAQALRHRETYDPRSERRSIVVDSGDRVILGSPELFDILSQSIPACTRALCTPASIAVRRADTYILGMRMPLADGGQYLAAYDIRPMLGRLRTISSAAEMGLLAVMLLAALISFRFSLTNLRRVDIISDALERYASGQREARVPTYAYHDEFARLGREINHTLDQVNLLVEEVKSTSGHIAHELRTPLTRLQNRLLNIADNMEGERRGEVLLAVDDISRIHGLARTIMRVGEIETGRCRHNFQPVDAATLLRDLAEYYQPLADGRRCRMDISVASPCPLVGDRDLLFQALANLVDNALKYGPEGEPIHLRADYQGDWVDLSVVDHGPGIAAELRAVALQRFRRLDNIQDKPGDGLGLPLVKAIAELHRGTLVLDDTHPGLTAIMRISAQMGAV